jgi:hypothetical protein
MIEFITIQNQINFKRKRNVYFSYLKNGRERAIIVRSHRVGCTT